MAERRMFAKTIIDSDPFLDLPLSAQALYFHLAMRADDDGFINNHRKIQRMVGCTDEDLQALIDHRFLLLFDSGVVVIKHWKIHNYIKKDRYKPTVYQDEKALLYLKASGAYTLRSQDGSKLDTQVRLGKDRLGEVRLGKERGSGHPPQEESRPYGSYRNVMLTDTEFADLKSLYPDSWEAKVEYMSKYLHSSGKTYANHLATMQLWAEQDGNQRRDGSMTRDEMNSGAWAYVEEDERGKE